MKPAPPAAIEPGTRRRKVLRYLFAPWCVLVLFPGVILATLFFASLTLLLAVFSKRLGFHAGTTWAWVICRLAWVRVRVVGREHLDPRVSYVILANHQGMVDIVAIYGHWFRQFRFVMKNELRKIPLLGAACASLDFVYVDRSNPRRAYESIEAAKPTLRDGVSVLFFPEGTRSVDGRLLPFKKGGFQLARGLELPILPVSVTGARHILPRGTVFTIPGRVDITIHPPIDPAAEGLTGSELTERVRSAILSGLSPWERSITAAAEAVGDPESQVPTG